MTDKIIWVKTGWSPYHQTVYSQEDYDMAENKDFIKGNFREYLPLSTVKTLQKQFDIAKEALVKISKENFDSYERYVSLEALQKIEKLEE